MTGWGLVLEDFSPKW